MKKLGLLIAILLLSFSVVAGTAVMAANQGDNEVSYSYFVPKTEVEIEDATYVTGTDGTAAVVVGITVTDGSAVVPATVIIEGVELPVTGIGLGAFDGVTAKEIRLPNTITEAADITGYNGYVFVQAYTPTAETIPVTGTVEKGPGVYYKGDYNANSEVTIADAIGMLQSIAGESFTEYTTLACNVVSIDDAVNLSDAIRLLQWIAANERVILD